jgi:hypothetical protein
VEIGASFLDFPPRRDICIRASSLLGQEKPENNECRTVTARRYVGGSLRDAIKQWSVITAAARSNAVCAGNASAPLVVGNVPVYARGRRFWVGDTRAPTTPAKLRCEINYLQAINDESSPTKRALFARAIQIECLDPYRWVETVSPDGVKVWVTQLRPR